MLLEDYIKSLKIGEKVALAHSIGVSPAAITRYGKPLGHPNKIYPAPAKAKQIEQLSKGAVTLAEMLDQEQIKLIWGENEGNDNHGTR